ncbi:MULTISPECIES: tautomerase family protein [Streptomyces]|uniref:4-oxalocrotonate tautomerase family protein n=1 Tax=Streptomyces noboritoensis TaxID=67337 RepID=A0ABV6TBF0_9ACTN
MPHLNVQIREEDLDGQTEPKLIRALTEAVASVLGEWAYAAAVVDLFGIPHNRRGTGGTPGAASAPIVTLHMRERGLAAPGRAEIPALLIGAITDAVCAALGEDARKHVTVLIVGIPTGRSGVGGEPV